MKNKKKVKVAYHTTRSIRERVILWLLEKAAPVHYYFCFKRKSWDLNSDDLLKFPEGSLGHTLGKFYKKEGFEPIAKAERHDVFHVLLGYSTGVKDESAMQFFLWGNGKASLFTIGTSLIAAAFFPTQWSFFRRSYLQGKNATGIADWNFRDLLSEDVQLLTRKIFIKA
jgi:ubiquinone biosynthesis protein Coq4